MSSTLYLGLQWGGGGGTTTNKQYYKHNSQRPRYLFPGRFGALPGRPGDLIKNLETPGKTGRVGRYVNYTVFIRLMSMRKVTVP